MKQLGKQRTELAHAEEYYSNNNKNIVASKSYYEPKD